MTSAGSGRKNGEPTGEIHSIRVATRRSQLQVLDENTVFHHGRFGLVVELCFPAAGLSASSGRFDRFPGRIQFVGIGDRDRHFVARMGFGASGATELLKEVFIHLCRIDPARALPCTVFDRTPVD